MNNEQSRQRPAAEVRLGNIRAAIWKNEGKAGIWYNATFERSYRDENEPRSSQTFGRDDLLVLAKVADLAHIRIFELQHEDRNATAES
jgi:hypothetical protein